MMSSDDFRNLALSLENAMEKPHFDRNAFCLVKGKNFATLHEFTGSVNLKLPLVMQSVFCDCNEHVHKVNNKWGHKGWTTFKLALVPRKLISEAVEIAYNHA